MAYIPISRDVFRSKGRIVNLGLTVLALCLLPLASAQDRNVYGDRNRYGDRDRLSRIEPGTTIVIRTNDTIDVERRDNRVYTGTVDQDVRGDNGRLAIPRGSTVEMIVRVAPDNDLMLDVESVVVDGQRYAMRTDSNR